MKVIALVGVSGSGKTTLAASIEESFDSDIVEIVSEATRGDICKFGNLSINFPKALQQSFDISRVEYQLKLEKENIEANKHKELVVIDKALPISLSYLLMMDSRYLSEKDINSFVQEVKRHCEKYYSIIAFLPPNNLQLKLKEQNRNFTNKHVLAIQHAALAETISWLNVPWVNVTSNYSNRYLDIMKSLESLYYGYKSRCNR